MKYGDGEWIQQRLSKITKESGISSFIDNLEEKMIKYKQQIKRYRDKVRKLKKERNYLFDELVDDRWNEIKHFEVVNDYAYEPQTIEELKDDILDELKRLHDV
tara:strand:- start:7507 stop:7815 length:309 start_codon:yes stop_codon:yes gene_type:complete